MLPQNPFFQTWELRGRYPNRGNPKIFKDNTAGEEAKKLPDDAQVMMKQIIADGSMTLKGINGLFPANCSDDGEDVDIYETKEAREAGMMGQQAPEKESDLTHSCLMLISFPPRDTRTTSVSLVLLALTAMP